MSTSEPPQDQPKPRRRGGARKLRKDAVENRDRILVAANELIPIFGLNLTAKVVARRADVGIATLYRRFPTRTQLLEALLQEPIDELRAAGIQALGTNDPKDAFLRYVTALYEAEAAYPGLLEALSRNGLLMTEWRNEVRKTLRSLVTKGVRAQVLREDLNWRDVPPLIATVAAPLGFVVGMRPSASSRGRLLAIALSGLLDDVLPLRGRPSKDALELGDLHSHVRAELLALAHSVGIPDGDRLPDNELKTRIAASGVPASSTGASPLGSAPIDA